MLIELDQRPENIAWPYGFLRTLNTDNIMSWYNIWKPIQKPAVGILRSATNGATGPQPDIRAFINPGDCNLGIYLVMSSGYTWVPRVWDFAKPILSSPTSKWPWAKKSFLKEQWLIVSQDPSMIIIKQIHFQSRNPNQPIPTFSLNKNRNIQESTQSTSSFFNSLRRGSFAVAALWKFRLNELASDDLGYQHVERNPKSGSKTKTQTICCKEQ